MLKIIRIVYVNHFHVWLPHKLSKKKKKNTTTAAELYFHMQFAIKTLKYSFFLLTKYNRWQILRMKFWNCLKNSTKMFSIICSINFMLRKNVLFLINFNFFANPIKLQVSWLIKRKKTKCNLIDNECPWPGTEKCVLVKLAKSNGLHLKFLLLIISYSIPFLYSFEKNNLSWLLSPKNWNYPWLHTSN